MDTLTDDDLERSVLSTVINHEGFIQAIPDLRGEHFAYPLNGRIFEAVREMVRTGDEPNPMTVHRQMAGDPELEMPSGPGSNYVLDVATIMAVSRVRLGAYAKRLVDLSRRRGVMALAERLAAQAQEIGGPTVEEMIASATESMTSLGARSDDFRDHHAVLMRIAHTLAEQRDCVSTGIQALDRSMGGGLFEGMCYGFEGVHKAGKSAMLGSIAYNLNERGVPIAYIAAEMGSVRLGQRLAARGMRRRAVEFLYRPREFASPVVQYRHGVQNNIQWSDMPGGSFAELRRRMSIAVTEHKVQGIIVDGWQLIGGMERGQSLESHLRAVAQWIADFGNEHRKFTIISAQLNHNGTAHSCSQGLEMACDQVYSLERAEGANVAWMRQRVSRYTPITHVGSATDMPLLFSGAGPYFEDSIAAPIQEDLRYGD